MREVDQAAREAALRREVDDAQRSAERESDLAKKHEARAAALQRSLVQREAEEAIWRRDLGVSPPASVSVDYGQIWSAPQEAPVKNRVLLLRKNVMIPKCGPIEAN